MPNIAVIGCGYWGPNLVRNFRSLGRSQLLVCVDKLEDRLPFIQSQFPTVRVTQSAEEIFRNPKIGEVASAEPNPAQ
jgi:predicted dehydrogenase